MFLSFFWCPYLSINCYFWEYPTYCLASESLIVFYFVSNRSLTHPRGSPLSFSTTVIPGVALTAFFSFIFFHISSPLDRQDLSSFLLFYFFSCTRFIFLHLFLLARFVPLSEIDRSPKLGSPQILNFNLWVSYLILSSVMWALRFVNFGCLPLIVYFEGLNFFPFLVFFFFYQNQFQLLLSRGPLSRACPLCRATKVLAGCSLYKGLLPSGISHHFFSHNPF